MNEKTEQGVKFDVDVQLTGNDGTHLTDLSMAREGSFYTIRGCGGSLQDWVDGMGAMLVEEKIGAPLEWFWATGEEVNEFAGAVGADKFPDDLTLLMFPLTGLDVGRLAMFKMRAGDTWFDDMIANMEPDRYDDDAEM